MRWLVKLGATAAAALLACCVSSDRNAPALQPAVDLDAQGHQPTLKEFGDCDSLDVCIARVDQLAPKIVYADDENSSEAVSKVLQRFGEPAKIALLSRASPANPGLCNWAALMLRYWPTWRSEDAPALKKASACDDRGHLAEALYEVGTPETAAILAENLGRSRPDNSETPEWAAKVGPPILALLTPMLADNSDQIRPNPAAQTVGLMGQSVASYAAVWGREAANSSAPENLRIGSLRGLSAMGKYGHEAGPIIRNLRTDGNENIRKQALNSLFAVRDPSSLPDAVATCESYDGVDRVHCLPTLADFGADSIAAGPALTKMLDEPDGNATAVASLEIGYIGYQPAAAKLEGELTSDDWRKVYGASVSLGWLGDQNALPGLDEVARTHWFSAVRSVAEKSSSAIRLSGALGRPGEAPNADFQQPWIFLAWSIDDREAVTRTNCTAGRYSWGGKTFAFVSKGSAVIKNPMTKLDFAGGRIEGYDYLMPIGPEGAPSGLIWRPRRGMSERLLSDNIYGIEQVGEDVIAVAGTSDLGFELAHDNPWAYAYATKIVSTSSGAKVTSTWWLPGRLEGLANLSPTEIAILSEGIPVVLNDSGIEGEALCLN